MSDPAEEKYPEPPANMAELLQRIETEWQALREFVSALPNERLTAPGNGGWSVKDHIAHLIFWEQIMVRSYLGHEPRYMVMGLSEEEAARLDSEEKINDWVYRRNRERPVSDVLSDAWRAHDETVRAIARESFARLQQPREPGGRYPLGAYVIGNTYGHYMEHTGWLRDLVDTA